MLLSHVGLLADVMWHEITNHAEQVELGEFVVMPNHIHCILILHENENNIGNENENEYATNNVETRHALSLQTQQTQQTQQTSQTPQTSETTNNYVKTRHALSLQTSQTPQTPQTPAQKRFRNPGKNTVSSIMGSYKSEVTKHAHRLGYEFGWQSRMWDHIVFNDESFIRITEYIQTNPQNWKDDKFYLANG